MADSEVRQKFEAWKSTLMKCIGGEAGCDGSLEGLEHEPNCPLFGKQFATHFDAFSAGMRAGEIARTERSDKDYAIEHAEYLAKAAEHLMDEINKYDMAESADEDGDCDARSDAWNGLRSAIGEFRKRAKRALPAAPEGKKPALSGAEESTK